MMIDDDDILISKIKLFSAQVDILVRKEVGNPEDFFDKTWDEYKDGFAANGSLNHILIRFVTIQQLSSFTFLQERAGLALRSFTTSQADILTS